MQNSCTGNLARVKLYLSSFAYGVSVLAILLGVFFRFYRLEHKVFWYDEIITFIRVSGHSKREISAYPLSRTAPVTAAELVRLQEIPRDLSLLDGLKRITQTSTKPPDFPLYYLLVRIWARLFDNHVTSARTFSAGIGVLVIIATFAFSKKLFDDTSVAWLSAAFVATSPYHLTYAQEARCYSLFALIMLLSGCYLVEIARRSTDSYRANISSILWVSYAILLAIGLLLHLLFFLIIFFHAVYLLAHWFRSREPQARICLARFFLTLVLVFVITGWHVYNLATTSEFHHHYTLQTVPFLMRLQKWELIIARFFMEPDLQSYWGKDLLASVNMPLLLSVLSIVAILLLCSKAPSQKSLFVVFVFLGSPLLLAGMDLILGGSRSTVARYLVPLSFAVELSLAYLLTQGLRCEKWLAQFSSAALFGVLIIIGLASAYADAASNSAGKEGVSSPDLSAVAAIINSKRNPVVIVSIDPYVLLSLSRLVRPEVIFLSNQSVARHWAQSHPLARELSGETALLMVNSSDSGEKLWWKPKDITSTLSFRGNLLRVREFSAATEVP